MLLRSTSDPTAAFRRRTSALLATIGRAPRAGRGRVPSLGRLLEGWSDELDAVWEPFLLDD